jgi:hypothetical protein
LLAVTASALFAARVGAQSNQDPDFSNVDDILHGNRTLLKMTDIEILSIDEDGSFTASWLLASNSSLSPSGGNGVCCISLWGIRSFSGWMWNKPSPVVISAQFPYPGAGAYLYLNAPPQYSPGYPMQVPAPPTSSLAITGAIADFNLDGYDDFAFSYGDRTIAVVTAADVNNSDAGLTLGPSAKLDPLGDMTAGDFKGDGKREIAGLIVLPNGGAKLVVYTVDPKTLAITPASSLVLTTPAASNANPITWFSIARGKFDTLAHDQLAVAFATDSADPGQSTETVEIVDFEPNSLTAIEVNDALGVSSVAVSGGWIQVKTGQFAFPNPYDQIVFHSSRPASGGRFFEIISVDSTKTKLALTAHTPVGYDEWGCSGGLDVGNFDHQETDQNSGKPEHDPNAQIAFIYGTLR